MATINYAAKEISVKIVYYGPALSGKTTNLQIIHRKIPQQSKSDMVSLATETDRTLFFDFLPLDLGTIKGFAIKFQLYTVPGQVYYNATRKLVLRGVDGIAFVADSAANKMEENLESFQNMEDNLTEYGYKRESIPIILQYNKRDVPNALPCAEIDRILNKYNFHWNEAIANKGPGVFETLKLIGKLVLDQLNKKYASPAKKVIQTPPAPPQVQPSRFAREAAVQQEQPSRFSREIPPVQETPSRFSREAAPPQETPARFGREQVPEQRYAAQPETPLYEKPTTRIPVTPAQFPSAPKRPSPYGFTPTPHQAETPAQPLYREARQKSDLDKEIELYHEKMSRQQPPPDSMPPQQFQSRQQPRHTEPEPLFEITPKPAGQPAQFSPQHTPEFVTPPVPNNDNFEPVRRENIRPSAQVKPVAPESIPHPRDFAPRSGAKKPMYFTTMDGDEMGRRERRSVQETEKPKKSIFGKLFKRDSE